MHKSPFFTPTKDYTFVSEDCKPTENDAPTLAKITVTIPNPRCISESLFHLQFKDKFSKGAVSGILPEIVYKNNHFEDPKIVLTFTIGKKFDADADKLFRETIAQLDQLTLRDKDALRIDYERCLDAHNIVSDHTKRNSHASYQQNHKGGSFAH